MIRNPLRARRDRAQRRLAEVFLARPDACHFGWDTARAARISSGVLYPLLARMEVDGWLESGWEDPAPVDRPARRWYRLTELGRLELSALLSEEAAK
ncbi:PadR family transcriptional regulator [Nocardia wallacei]|uniref:PadR family transcriptional regulator n=1 Tax=Nocardia wallacei TaxID=480035 RepID=UPI002458E4C8|nr:PadR family transcriptional regulator [Nocardia wallacei]